MIMSRLKGLIVLLWLLFVSTGFATAGTDATLRGRVVDAKSGEGLAGATIRILQAGRTAVTDNDGAFTVGSLGLRNYTLEATYLGYRKASLTVNPTRTDSVLTIRMEELEESLHAATVSARAKHDTENAIVTVQRTSLVVQNGVSAQQISKTQDKDASEVIRRVPGISIIDEKFVMVRGLSQRYNNVWINGAAVPSSEPDTRAFSFDLIPSSQVDNMQIIKSPAPQYPADFSGGFILIDTKDVPGSNSARVSLGAAANDQTHFQDFYAQKGGPTDFLGFDGSLRPLAKGIDTPMRLTPGGNIDLLANGLNNDWTVRRRRPAADANLAADITRSRDFDNGAVLAVLAALNYSNGYKTYSPMKNALYGAYDITHDASNYLHDYTDHQYSHNVRLGAMLNLTFVPATGAGRYEWKNIFNQLGTDRYTSRTGVNAQNDHLAEGEYYYSSRTTYSTQLTGKYAYDVSRLDWNAGYAYANRLLPDRRRYTLDDSQGEAIGLTSANEVTREWTRLDEHIASGGANYRHRFESRHFEPELYAGAYAEYRTRAYNTRDFVYLLDPTIDQRDPGFRYQDFATQIMQPGNYGDSGLTLLDKRQRRNDYEGRHLISAAYAAVNLPFGALSIYAGLRFEYSRMELISNTRDYEVSHKSKFYNDADAFPSLNATYRLNGQSQLRASYGRSVNRAEFREVSSSSFYDFDLSSFVSGNPDLKSCYIDNADLRFEWYPAAGDQISVAAFYKHFRDPIEWTYTVVGGTDLSYSYQNAESAHSYGIEIDIRKNLGFIAALKDFTLVFNGALIKSKVSFADGSREKDRPMQGQSPYLVNLGIFYSHEAWNASLQYNRIGKRLIGVGRQLGATADQTVTIPDSYEMPRNSLDLSASHTFFGHLELKAGIRDVLAEKICFKQFNDATLADKTVRHIEEVTRSYRPGRTYNLSLSYKF